MYFNTTLNIFNETNATNADQCNQCKPMQPMQTNANQCKPMQPMQPMQTNENQCKPMKTNATNANQCNRCNQCETNTNRDTESPAIPTEPTERNPDLMPIGSEIRSQWLAGLSGSREVAKTCKNSSSDPSWEGAGSLLKVRLRSLPGTSARGMARRII